MRLAIVLILALGPSPLAAGELENRIAPLARNHHGQVAVAVKHLVTGEEYYLAADEPMPTASLIKLPIMVETYWQASEGKIKLDSMLTLREEDKVPGSGILRPHFSAGASFSLRDTVRMMIVFSDNTATNMVLDQIGIPSTNVRMEKLGLTNTKINAKVYLGSKTSIDPERTKKFGLGSTTAREMVKLLEWLQAGKLVNPQACQVMIDHLKNCDDPEMFKRDLPNGVVLAHKTGAVSNARTSAGIIYTKSGPVALCVLTNNNRDQRYHADNEAHVLLGKIARQVHDHFSPVEKK